MSAASRRARERMSPVERAALGTALADVQLRARVALDDATLRAAAEANPFLYAAPVRTLAEDALKVLVLTPHVRRYLEQHDPMALRQARTALGLYTELAV